MPDETPAPQTPPATRPTGHWAVFGMFGFAITMVGLLYVYWHFYTEPFRELQYAIAAEYPKSSPRVVGGRHKSHRLENPLTLRVVAYIPEGEFDPLTDDDASEQRALDLVRLTQKYVKLQDYQIVEIVLLQKVPEGARKHRVVTRTLEEWDTLLQQPTASTPAPDSSASSPENQQDAAPAVDALGSDLPN